MNKLCAHCLTLVLVVIVLTSFLVSGCTPASPTAPTIDLTAIATVRPESTVTVVPTLVPPTVPPPPPAPTTKITLAQAPTGLCPEASVVQLMTVTPSSAPINPDVCFPPDQIIVLGRPGDIDTVVERAAALGDRRLLKEIPLYTDCQSKLELPKFPRVDNLDLVARLYEMIAGASVPDAVAQIAKAAEDAGVFVIADPNYLVGDPGTPLKGRPHIPGGSPSQGGPAQAPYGLFGKQWALSNIGLSGPEKSGGAGVRVGVFDTSPFDLGPLPTPGATPGVTIPRYEASFKVSASGQPDHEITMCVTRFWPSVQIKPGEDHAFSAADHGLFVAGLVKAVAPDAEIHLYQVLDETATGDLFTLMEAFKDFVCTGKPEQSVANLSLGLHWYSPVNGAAPTPVPTKCAGWSNDFAQVLTFYELLAAAQDLGVTVVASAGNNSNRAANPPVVEAADMPAGWGNGTTGVIGVEAVNHDGSPACFSNEAPIWAPGGEGWDIGSGQCGGAFDACQNAGSCEEFGLVSLATQPSTGYLYWAGTSFAAPLVSGLAARCLQANATATTPWKGSQVTANVRQAIQAGASSHSNVMNVPDTLSKCK